MNNPQNLFADYGSSQCCIFDSNRGIYNMVNIIRLAMSYGFKDDDLNADMTDQEMLDYEEIHDAVTDAESFLDNLLPDGYWFGYSEHGDVGIFKNEDEYEGGDEDGELEHYGNGFYVRTNDESQLIDRAIENIKKDVTVGDVTAIEELLKFVPLENLKVYLREDGDGFGSEEEFNTSLEKMDTLVGNINASTATIKAIDDKLSPQMYDVDGDTLTLDELLENEESFSTFAKIAVTTMPIGQSIENEFRGKIRTIRRIK